MTKSEDCLIETANGSFYDAYKDGLLKFLEVTAQSGLEAVNDGKLLLKDAHEVERGVSMLRENSKDLFPLLGMRIDERNPTFYDECTIEVIWNLLGAVYLVAQHSDITDKTKIHSYLRQTQAGEARMHKRNIDEGKKQKQIKRIMDTPTYKAANGGYVKVGAVAEECRLGADRPDDRLSASTIRRRLADIKAASGLKPDSQL